MKKWKTGIDDPEKSRLGCFLPDLTRWARNPSITDLPSIHIGFLRAECKGFGKFVNKGQYNGCKILANHDYSVYGRL